MKRLIVLLTALLLLAFPRPGGGGADAAAQFPVTVVDDMQVHVRIAHQPKRILSLDARDTETLFALGLEKRLVGDGSQYSEGAANISRNFRYPSEWPSRWGRDYPVRARKLPHVEGGYGTTPFNLETIERLRPDVIFSLKSDLPTLQKMRDLGLKVIVLDPANFAGILHDIALVGRVTGASSQAAQVASTVRAQIAAVRKQLGRAHGRPTVYYEIDATNPTQPYTAGPGTFIDEAIRLARGSNVADGATSLGCPGTGCYPQFSLESLVRLDPQIILLGDAAYGTTVAGVKARAGWSTISAVQSGKIYPFNDEVISRAGPRIGVGLRQLARLIHPQAFR